MNSYDVHTSESFHDRVPRHEVETKAQLSVTHSSSEWVDLT